ncbi:MAG: DUF1801 domain-containing protein [Verrucomicrobia bacterium]|nr:DUF1801 domain-containing protein [Verrucomicrobiota bacterium]
MIKSSNKKPAGSIDEYLSALPAETKATLEKLRQTIRKAAPTAEEAISYGMPAFKYHGTLVYFAAFKNHCSLFPGNAGLIISMKEELSTYHTSKGTIQFTNENPLPSKLVVKIVKARVSENVSKQKNKTGK